MHSQSSPPARFRWRRFSLIALLTFIGLLILAILVAPAVIRRTAEQALADAGFTQARIEGLRLMPRGLRIARIDLAPENRFFLRDIRIRLSWDSLRAGRAETVAIGAVRLEAGLSPAGGFELPGFRPPEEAADPVTELPFETLTLATGSLVLATPQGPLALAIRDARAIATGAQIELGAGLEAEHAMAQLTARLSATAQLDRRSYAAGLDILTGALEAEGAIARGLRGSLSAAMEPDAPMQAELALAIDEMAYREIALGAADLSVALSGESLTYRLISPSEGLLALDISGDADLEAREGRLSGELRIPSLAALPGSRLEGRLRLAPDLAFTLQPGAPQASGRIELAAETLLLPDVFEGGALELEGRFSADRERLTITADAPWHMQTRPNAQILPEALEAYAGAPVSLELAPPEREGAIMLEANLVERTATLHARITARAADSRIETTGDMRLAATEAGFAVDAQPLALSAQALRWDTLTLGIERFSGEAGLSSDGRYHLTGAGELTVDGEIAALGVETGELSWSGRIAGDTQELRIEPDRCLSLRAGAVTLGELRVEAPEPPCLGPREGEPLLSQDMTSGMTTLSLKGAAGPLDLALVRADQRHRITGHWPALSLAARLGAEGPESVAAELDGGALQLAGQPYRAGGLAATLTMTAGRIEKATLKAEEIRSLAEPALFAPLGFDATARRDGDGLALEAFLSDMMGIFVFEAAGRAEADSGKLDLTLYPVEFLPDATEPGDLSPALGALVSDMRGPLGFAGGLSWNADGLQSDGRIDLGPLSFSAAGLRLSGLEGTIALDSLLPLSTSNTQELRLAAANIGLLLTDGRLRFDLETGGRIAVEDLRFDLAGGRLSADPFILDLSQPQDTAITMRADGVDLEKLVVLSGIKGLEGSGKLTGRLPLALTAGGLTIADGMFEAAGDGVLRYIPEELPAFLRGDDLRSRLLREALQNFQYDTLSLTLSGDVGARQRIALKARGANPDFLEGHPVELNVTVDGPLVSVVQSAIGGSGARALERMFRNPDGQPDGGLAGEETRP